jgi:hypothetical protein
MLITFPDAATEVFTVRGRDIVCVTEALAPVIFKIEFPAGVFGAVLTERAEFNPGVIVAGLREAVAPAGSPLTLRFTNPLNPFMAPMLTVEVVLFPLLTLEESGVVESVKSGAELCPTGTICIPFRGAR